MAIRRSVFNWAAYVRCYWRNPYSWDPSIAVGTLMCPEGMAEIALSFQQWPGQPRVQMLTVDTIRGGRTLHYREERTERDYVTQRGAQIVARRWLRELERGDS